MRSSKARSLGWWLAAAGVWVVGLGGTGARAADGAPLECVDHKTEARYRGYGYDHLVHLENRCEKAARCEVSTDVNPEKQTVTVAPKAKETVVTFRGSAAREFHAIVNCTGAG